MVHRDLEGLRVEREFERASATKTQAGCPDKSSLWNVRYVEVIHHDGEIQSRRSRSLEF